MMSYVSAEWRKLPKFQLLLIGLTFLFFASISGLAIYYFNRDVFIEDTQSIVMWGNLTFYHSQLFYPAMLAIFMGISLMAEFERTTLDMLRANGVSISKLLGAKYITLLLVLLPLQLLLVVIWFVGMSLDHVVVLDELGNHVKWVLLSVLGSLSILSAQSLILAKTRNFAKSVGLAALGGIGGFLMIFLGDRFSRFYPYSQAMVALHSRALEDISCVDTLLFIGVNTFFTLLFSYLTLRQLKQKN